MITQHLGVPDQPGWLRRRHEGIEALGKRGTARRSRQADRLADALESVSCPAELQARVRLMGDTNPRTAVARAAIAAWNDDRPSDTRRWLHVVDRLPRDRNDPGYRSVRADLARVRAEVSYSTPAASPRPDLLQQANRRARSPDEKVTPYVAGLAKLRDVLVLTYRLWRAGISDLRPSPSRVPDAQWHSTALLHQGAVDSAAEVLPARRCRQ